MAERAGSEERGGEPPGRLRPLVVAALGGNALLRRGERLDFATQVANARIAADGIRELASIAEVVVTHGNGPQVGLLALEDAAYASQGSFPLDVLGAESQGMIGYLLESALRNALPERTVATILTQVEVEPGAVAPSKPIGPMLSVDEAEVIRRTRGWSVGPDGPGFRRLVPSPKPRRIVELDAVRLLVDGGVLVICAGGGGVPVAIDDAGHESGLEAVVDKDLTASLLARELEADALLLLTDVDAVYSAWGTGEARAIRHAPAGQLRGMEFAEGSMAPKVEAACAFVEATGRRAGIGAMGEAAAILTGQAGTLIVADKAPPGYR